ncbi:MAG: FtsX-like permease family protein [Clostridiales bacterium]|nr:FtsX-like permease family protein [Clostridiales bacterium]
MGRSMWKDIFRQIRSTPRRFIAILIIVALGAAFFSGVRATSPDMQLTVDHYFNEYHTADIRLVSTMGFNEDDIDAVRAVEGIQTVQPAYSTDGFILRGENRQLVNFQSCPFEAAEGVGLNLPVLMEGRFPQTAGECLMDEHLANSGGYAVGDTIDITTEDDEEISDALSRLSYTLVGTVRSTYYISLDRGSSAKGTGNVSGFVLLPAENFSLSVYTDLFLSSSETEGLSRFTDAYDKKIEALCDRLKESGDQRNPQRLEELRTQVEEKLSDARREVAEGEQQLRDGEQELSDARQEWEDGWRELENGQAAYDREMTRARQQLDDAAQQLSQAEQELETSRQELEEGKRQLESGEVLLNQKKQELDAGEAGMRELEAGIAQLEGILSQMPEQAPQWAALNAQLKQLRQTREEQLPALLAGRQAWEQGVRELEESRQKWEEGQSSWEAGQREYETGRTAYEKNLAAFQQMQQEKSEELSEARRQLEDARRELDSAQAEFDEKSAEAYQKLEEARRDIADGEEQRDKLMAPEWISLDLDKNVGFAGYRQDADRIAAIGMVFPLIFFLVAALVSLTNMTRMVEDDRSVIGLYKALGYGRMTIAAKYLLYSGLAASLGIVLGLAVGQKLFPWVIFDAYGILYRLPPIRMPLNIQYSLTAAAGSLACAVLPAFLVCQKELMSTPSSLMRPRAPREGKRILLERITPIWKRLNFSNKVTCRNIFRYKKRLLMTILGIAGCTALVFTGFGLRDSIDSIAGRQYDEIQQYDFQADLTDDFDAADRAELDRLLEGEEPVGNHAYFLQQSIDVLGEEGMKSASLLVPAEMDSFDSFIDLRERRGHVSLTLEGEGVVITEKLSMLLGIRKGDLLRLKDTDNRLVECRVDGIAENYVYHYLYMAPETYERLTGSAPVSNAVFGQLNDTSELVENDLSAVLLEQDYIGALSFNTSLRENFSDMIGALNIVVVVLILSAGALAFIVLFSLTTINIDERKRELATLKVLGFYEQETAMYIYRENLILTLLGVAAGLVLGVVLLAYVITTAEVDMVMFARTANWPSYVIAALMTLLFSLVVNGMMSLVIRKIDMVESMKSVE